MAVLNRELEAGFGTTVSVRTGVNMGQVITGTDERLATGDAAAELAKRAGDLVRATDALEYQGDAALNLAAVRRLESDLAGTGEAAGRAIDYYRRKGATACVARAQRLAAECTSGSSTASRVTRTRQRRAENGHTH